MLDRERPESTTARDDARACARSLCAWYPARAEDVPMPRLDRLPEPNRKNLLVLPVQVNETAPFARPARPLTGCRLAIVTTAGLHRRGDRPFGPGDQGYRVIPSDTPTADIVQSHTSLGFDRTPIMRDLNVSFPI